MRRRLAAAGRLAILVLLLVVPAAVTLGDGMSTAGSPTLAGSANGDGAAAFGRPETSDLPLVSPEVTAPPGSPAPTPKLEAYRAPALVRPLAMLDPGLASRGPRPTLRQLLDYQYGNPAVMFAPHDVSATDWRLANPDQAGVRGYAGDVSVTAGHSLALHLTGSDPSTRLDVYRMGLDDARLVASVRSVAVHRRREASIDPTTGLLAESWPVSYRLPIPASWSSGVYLIKLTGTSGRQSYIPFIVRPTRATPLMVVIPTMTWQAYNAYGGPSLYGWPGGAANRAFMVSFDRPYQQEFGAGLFFRLDFPLIVWLEDHGYQPTYVSDLDIDRTPALVKGAQTLIFSGHSEYWTGGMRDQLEQAGNVGTNLVFFGANQAFWQVRLDSGVDGSPDRVVICYKYPTRDPILKLNPSAATTRFQDPPVNRPPAAFMGLEYGGIIDGILPMVLAAGIEQFAPDLGLRLGQSLPGLIADEVDEIPRDFNGLILGATPVNVQEHQGAIAAGAALWINPSGSRVFDAGTFDFAWGLDPRYAAALPGFPADAFSQLTARILAWAGAQPTR